MSLRKRLSHENSDAGGARAFVLDMAGLCWSFGYTANYAAANTKKAMELPATHDV